MKKIIRIILVSLLLIVQTSCNAPRTFNNDIELYTEIRNNTLSKNNYSLVNECNIHNVYSDTDTDNEGSGERVLRKTIIVEGDNKLIQDTLIGDDYEDTFYIIEYDGKVYDQKNNEYIDNKESFYEANAYLLVDRFLLETDNITKINKIDDTRLEIEFNEKINELAEVIFRSCFHEREDGPKMTKFEVNNYKLSYTNDYLLDEVEIEANVYFNSSSDDGFSYDILVNVDNYDQIDLPITEESVAIKPERQYFSKGYVDKNGNLFTNDKIHPNQNFAVAYFNTQFENDEFDIGNPYGYVQLLDCTNISLDDYYEGKSPIEYVLYYDEDVYYWLRSDTEEEYPYLYYLDDDYFTFTIDDKEYFFSIDDYQYIKK